MSDYEIIENDTGNGTGRMMLFDVGEEVTVERSHREDVTSRYFVASATSVPGLGDIETFVFAADEDGEIVNWGELPGSRKGTMDPEAAADRFVDHIQDGVVSR